MVRGQVNQARPARILAAQATSGSALVRLGQLTATGPIGAARQLIPAARDWRQNGHRNSQGALNGLMARSGSRPRLRARTGTCQAGGMNRSAAVSSITAAVAACTP